MENSFGRKIKNNFSVTFKKDEEKLKLWVNEQVVPAAYIKQLILDDMNKKENHVTVKNEIENKTEDKEENRSFSNFDFDFDE